MNGSGIRIGVIQMAPNSDKAGNIGRARHLIDRMMASDRPDIVALPEMWSCLGGDRATKFAAAERLPDRGGTGGQAYEFLRDMARTHHVYLHGGSIAELASGSCSGGVGGRLFNTTVFFDQDGREVGRYRKIHLFDMVAPDGQGYRETAVYGAGDDVVTIKVGDWNVGLTICYDLRFPELFLALRRAGADLIMVPAAFTWRTGKDHWEVLLRARAIETQCYVAAPACEGTHFDGSNAARVTYGNSMIIDPWGMVAARAGEGAGFCTARLDMERLRKIRRDMPVFEHRRLI